VRRHSTDPVALLAGALFITVGAAYLGGALSDTNIEARWVLPTVLITLGFTGLLVSLVNLARQRRTAGVTAQPVGGGEAPSPETTATTPEPMQSEPVQPGPVGPETLPLETVPRVATETETAKSGTAEPETVEPETVELKTESPDAEPPQTVPLETSPAKTSPMKDGNESGDEPRDRS
jgi:hypothetical protein